MEYPFGHADWSVDSLVWDFLVPGIHPWQAEVGTLPYSWDNSQSRIQRTDSPENNLDLAVITL
jgi:hypothetical protein